MNEKEIISKIQALKSIQPEKEWVLATKTQILGETRGQRFVVNFNQAFLAVPALAIICLVGIFLYNQNIIFPKTASVDPAILQAITTNLRTVESGITKATADLEKVKEPEKVLEIKEAFSSTIENGGKVVAIVKEIVEISEEAAETPEQASSQALTVIAGIEHALKDMESAYFGKEKDMAEQLIKDLETKSLTENQKAFLEQAKNYYNQGDFSQALIKAIAASQIR